MTERVTITGPGRFSFSPAYLAQQGGAIAAQARGFTPYEIDKANEAGEFEGHMGDSFIRTVALGVTEFWLAGSHVGNFATPGEAMLHANFTAKLPAAVPIRTGLGPAEVGARLAPNVQSRWRVSASGFAVSGRRAPVNQAGAGRR